MNSPADVSMQQHTLVITAPMTIYEAEQHMRAVLAALDATESLVLDLRGVDEMDTSGLQLLLLALRQARKAGKSLELAGASGAVEEVLGRYRLTTDIGGWLQSPGTVGHDKEGGND